METRQLALFVLACQYVSHAEAAAVYGISPSALSEAISGLEADLGLVLFLRGPLGHAPTEAARWLFQLVEPMLQLLEVATVSTKVPAVRHLDVSCALYFSFGKLSRVLALAARMLREQHPGTVVRISFQSEQTDGQGQSSDLFLSYGIQQDNQTIILFDDEWVVITANRPPAVSASLYDFQGLQRLFLPPLPSALKPALLLYCERIGLPHPLNLPIDTDIFEFVNKQAEQVAVLAPRSLIAGGAIRHKFSVQPIEPPLVTPVVAQIRTYDHEKQQLISSFLAILQRFLREPQPALLYDPVVSLRQLRMVTMLSRYQNMSSTARVLNVAQPALSVQLKKLEQVVGVTMFARHSGGMTLLSEAKPRVMLFEQAIAITNDIRLGALERKTQKRANLHIGITVLLAEMNGFRKALAKTIAKCSIDYPSTRLHVSQWPGLASQHELQSGRLDVLVSEQAGPIKGGHHIGYAGAVGAVYFATEGDASLPVADLLKVRPMVLAPVGSVIRTWTDQFCDRHQLPLRPALEIESPYLSYSVARERNLGTVLPKSLFTEFAGEGTEGFWPFLPEIMINISLKTFDSRMLDVVEHAFTRHLRSYLAEANTSEIGMARFPQ